MAAFNEILTFFMDSVGQFADRSAKWLLSNRENLRGLLQIIGKDLVASLDFSQMRRVNTTFIADNLREQESDLVFLLPFRDTDETEVMIYILIEHQSTVDPVMGFGCYRICITSGMTNGSSGSLRVSRKVSGDFVRSSLLYFIQEKQNGAP